MAMRSSCGLFFFSTVALVLVFASSISKVENVEQRHHGEGVRKVHEDGEAVPQQFWDRFFNGFYASLYVIIISELGDKTFFIAAIMSMQHSRCLVYSGAMGALATMTILSAMLGYATTVVPRKLTYYTSGILFLLFGLKMLYDAYKMSPSNAQEEYEEVKQQLSSTADPEAGRSDSPPQDLSFRLRLRMTIRRMFSPILAEAFILTFLAEWGDRSQITTIVMAATKVLRAHCNTFLFYGIFCCLAALHYNSRVNVHYPH